MRKRGFHGDGRLQRAAAAIALLMGIAPCAQAQSGSEATPALRLQQVGTPSSSFHVTATLVVGPTESVLWDAQYRVSDGQRLADAVAATGTRLKAIVLSHADHDHYMGAMELLKRFQGTPVYMAETVLEDYRERSSRDFEAERRRGGLEVPDSIVRPEALPATGLTVDGHAIEVIGGLTGDVRGPRSSALWIPSLETVLAGDLVFDGIHPWLGDADFESRAAWRDSLRRLAALEPARVFPGHQREIGSPDGPELIDFMLQYLDDYDELMRQAQTYEELQEAMVERYPDLALPGLMGYGAKRWFKR